MNVICAPDSFKGSLTAVEAAEAMADGMLQAAPDSQIDRCPVGDGGEGTLEALLFSMDGVSVQRTVADVFGRTRNAAFGLLDEGRIAFVESATAIGLGVIPAAERDLMRSSSFGVGQLILHAARYHPEQIIVGVGGSATNDAGCGMAQALGVRFFDRGGNLISQPVTGGMLQDIKRIDANGLDPLVGNATIIVACDVDSPMTGPRGAAQVFAPQKGASRAQVAWLDRGLQQISELMRRDLDRDVEMLPGAGAAGGLGAGLMAFAGATARPGIDTVLEFLQFDRRACDAHLCLTGEGRVDAQTLAGKACIGVARAAARFGVRTVLLAGRAGPGAERVLDSGISEVVEIGEGLSNQDAMRRAAILLTEAACRIGRQLSASSPPA